VLPYNDVPALEAAFAQHGPDVACLMIEPIAGNMNFVRASVPFMTRCRELCTQHGALLAFDEVMTGFRVGLGSAQGVYASLIPGFEPDLTVMGKVIGGGMPLAAFGGKRAVMEQLAPLGAVYQAGTLSGNPVATACGLATLKEIQKPGFFEALSARTQSLTAGLQGAADAAGVPFCTDSQGGMFGFFLMDTLPQNYATVMTTSNSRFNTFFHGMLDRGVYFAPALYEAGFVSAAHTAADVQTTVDAAAEVFKTL
jgi:glutamate-1-semialdehyde 2,1-aminomutase